MQATSKYFCGRSTFLRGRVKRCPKKALAKIMYEAAAGKFNSWDEAFGRIFARKKRATMYKKAREMIAAYNRVIELNRENRKDNPIGNKLYEQVGEELASAETG